ncbi:MAG: alpha/beta fold hydrolase, partial [Rubricoccaceae bacterium]|nr:alpha/beta fold hydrolase [Rubricoccaceae bacterium]
MSQFTLEHLGIAVRDPDGAIDLFRRLLGASPYKVQTVESEGVQTYFIGDGGIEGATPKIELLHVVAPTSPVAKFLEKRGPGFHHLAFEVSDIETEMRRLADAGFHVLSDVPKEGADNKRVVFLHPRTTGGILIELCETIAEVPEQIAIPFEGQHLVAFASGPEEAPPLIVLHAALGSTELETRRLIQIWERNYRVYALDFMGHGESDSSSDVQLTIETFADNLFALIDHLDIDKPNLFGFSLGGSVALCAAARQPERFNRLVIHAHNVQWTSGDVERMVGAMQSVVTSPDSFWAKRLSAIHGASRWKALVNRMISFTEALAENHITDQTLSSVSLPTLVSVGSRDRFFGIQHAVSLHAVLPNSDLWVLPGVDHPIQTVQPASFA